MIAYISLMKVSLMAVLPFQGQFSCGPGTWETQSKRYLLNSANDGHNNNSWVLLIAIHFLQYVLTDLTLITL